MKIEKSTYIRRRAQLKKDMGSGLLLFLGNDEVGMNYADNTYPFRQDSTLLYFFGLDYAGLAAVIDVDEDREIVFGNELTIDDIVWTGTQPSLKDKCSEIGISDTMPMKELKNYIDKARAKGQTIHFLPPYRHDTILQMQGLGLLPQGGGREGAFFISYSSTLRSYPPGSYP
jgi:Xaa-Pro aminopeptidase